MTKSKRNHKHYWFHPQSVYDGRKKTEVGVVRFCDCGKRNMAFADDWRKPPKAYDVSTMSLRDLKSL